MFKVQTQRPMQLSERSFRTPGHHGGTMVHVRSADSTPGTPDCLFWLRTTARQRARHRVATIERSRPWASGWAGTERKPAK